MPGGRPTVYKPENAEIARHACMLGATNESLAERFEVCRRTIDNWIATIPEFSDAVRQGRQVADETVISALFARATGMEQKMTKVFCHRGQPIMANYTVQLPPDVRACVFWLRNRRPGQWRENRPLADGKDDEEWVSELEAVSERARLASIADPSPLEEGCPSLPDFPLQRPPPAALEGQAGADWRSACGNCGNHPSPKGSVFRHLKADQSGSRSHSPHSRGASHRPRIAE